MLLVELKQPLLLMSDVNDVWRAWDQLSNSHDQDLLEPSSNTFFLNIYNFKIKFLQYLNWWRLSGGCQSLLSPAESSCCFLETCRLILKGGYFVHNFGIHNLSLVFHWLNNGNRPCVDRWCFHTVNHFFWQSIFDLEAGNCEFLSTRFFYYLLHKFSFSITNFWTRDKIFILSKMKLHSFNNLSCFIIIFLIFIEHGVFVQISQIVFLFQKLLIIQKNWNQIILSMLPLGLILFFTFKSCQMIARTTTDDNPNQGSPPFSFWTVFHRFWTW